MDDASAKGIAEIESSKLALQKSTSAEVRKFAQVMINDHTAANAELTAIARTKKLKVDDDATMTAKAKEFIVIATNIRIMFFILISLFVSLKPSKIFSHLFR